MPASPVKILLSVALGCAAPLVAQSTIHEWDGPRVGARFGEGLAFVGDVDQDRVIDMVVGAPSDGANLEGSLFLYSGRSGALLREMNGTLPGGRLGTSVAAPGDIDGDGVPDIAAGAPYAEFNGIARAGVVEIYSGATGSLLRTIGGSFVDEEFGFALDAGLDADRDGFADLIIGVPGGSGGGNLSGLARVHSAASGALLFTLNGTLSDDRFGYAVAVAGDVDGDNFLDIVIGVPEDDTASGNAGAVQVYSGRNGILLNAFFGQSVLSQFGYSVDGVGDVDGDGLDDIVVGAPFEAPTGSGAAYILSPASGSQIQRVHGSSIGDEFGLRVAGCGDYNDDGVPDVAVSAPSADRPGLSDTGAVAVVSGASGATLRLYAGRATSDQFGLDLDGNGWRAPGRDPDLLIGAAASDAMGLESGAATAVLFFSAPIIASAPLTGGNLATIQGSWFTPGGLATFAFSRTGGGPTNTFYGPALLSPPIRTLAPVLVDAQGRTTLSALVPASWSGTTVWLQAIDVSLLGLSNGLQLPVQ